MKEKQLQIAPGFTIPANDYANQANAVLGIREAGKTYTAMKAAEELLDNSIPIIVFDPVGIWKNLKIGTGTGIGKHMGYPIVVAGGEGADIRLTKDNAVDIVRASMKENISLVLDFYSPELINKSTWIHIVHSVVDLLMYENKSYGLRHIFLEEAAEFIPQKLQPQHARVYSSLERVARMGRNAHLGMTIINQRAEEVNKAILEICELCLIHKQVGKNSLLSIQKWLEVRQLENVKDIIKSLPVLAKGECWAVGLSDQPQQIQVSKKNTYHPNPKEIDKDKANLIKTLARDVTTFVSRMNEQLEKAKAPKKPAPAIAKPPAPADGSITQKDFHQITNLREEVRLLKQQLTQRESESHYLKKAIAVYEKRNNDISDQLSKISDRLTDSHGIKVGGVVPLQTEIVSKPANIVPAKREIVPKNPAIVSTDSQAVKGAERKIIIFLAQFPDRQFSKVQIGVATGYKIGGGSFNNALSRLNTLGFIIRGGKFQVNPDALPEIIQQVGEIPQTVYGFEHFKHQLVKAEREIYQVLMDHPDAEFTKQEIAERTESRYKPEGGSYNNALSRLNTLELLRRQNGLYRLNPELLEIM